MAIVVQLSAPREPRGLVCACVQLHSAGFPMGLRTWRQLRILSARSSLDLRTTPLPWTSQEFQSVATVVQLSAPGDPRGLVWICVQCHSAGPPMSPGKYPGDVPNPCATSGQISCKQMLTWQGLPFVVKATWKARERGRQLGLRRQVESRKVSGAAAGSLRKWRQFRRSQPPPGMARSYLGLR